MRFTFVRIAIMIAMTICGWSVDVFGLNCQDGAYHVTRQLQIDGYGLSEAVADFNKDGKLDLAIPNYFQNNIALLLGDGTGNFAPATHVNVCCNPPSVTTADFNKDGKPDLAVGVYGGVNVFLGDGAGGFGTPTVLSAGTGYAFIVSANFNGDNKPDLAVANLESNNVSIFLGDGSGGFSGPVNFAVGINPFGIVVNDFNKDGKMDLATANANTPSISILLGNGAGSFSAAPEIIGNTAHRIATGDFNKDGKPDLVANTYDNTLRVLLGDGAGNFTIGATLPLGGVTNGIIVVDLNNDSNLDLAVSKYNENSIGYAALYMGDGAGNFDVPRKIPVISSAQGIAAGDFNNDGKQELAVSLSSQYVAMLGREDFAFCADFKAHDFNTAFGPFTMKPLNSFSAATGEAVATTSTKAELFSPYFGICSGCTFGADLKLNTANTKIYFFGMYQDGSHYVEIQFLPDKIVLKQKAGALSAKKKMDFIPNLNQAYDVEVGFSDGQFTVTIDGVFQYGLVLKAVATPAANGTMKYRVKAKNGILSTGTVANTVVF